MPWRISIHAEIGSSYAVLTSSASGPSIRRQTCARPIGASRYACANALRSSTADAKRVNGSRYA
jgi:hypothetical protein